MYTTAQVQYAARLVFYLTHQPGPFQTRWVEAKEDTQRNLYESFGGDKDKADRLVIMIRAELRD